MAIKAIDHKNRYQITYLDEGIEISGESLNPMKVQMIPSGEKDEGLIKVTQTAKYSPYCVTNDGRIFEKNSFGSFKQIDIEFERFQDSGNPTTRMHSEFGGIIESEKKEPCNYLIQLNISQNFQKVLYIPGIFKFEWSVNRCKLYFLLKL